MNFITNGALGRTTPQIIKDVRDGIIYMVGGTLAFTALLAPLLGMSGTDFAMWSGFIILAVKGIAKLFGVSEDEAVKNVVKASDQVATIVETKKTDI